MSTIREILNDVLAQSGFLTRGQFFGSADPDSKQMCALANRVRAEIRDFFMWPALLRDYTLVLVEGQSRYTLPDDFWQMVPESVWETNGNRQAEWPTPRNRWYLYKFSGWSTGGEVRIRLVDDRVIEIPQALGGDEISFAYVSRYAVKAETGELKDQFTKDTDTFILPERLLSLGIQAHWAEVKMFPQAQQWMGNYMRKMNESISIETGAKVIGRGTLDGRGPPYYPLWRR